VSSKGTHVALVHAFSKSGVVLGLHEHGFPSGPTPLHPLALPGSVQ
jgi:hypothetical protein